MPRRPDALPADQHADPPHPARTRRGERLELPPLRLAVIYAGCGLLFGASLVGLMPAVVYGPGALGVLVATLLGVLTLLIACLPLRLPLGGRRLARMARAIGVCVGMLCLFLSLLFTVSVATTTASGPLERSTTSDVMAFTETNARLVLAGRNPYTSDDAFAATLRHFADVSPTPLRAGSFSADKRIPSPARMAAARAAYLAAPQQSQGEFDPRTLHSYPALSFLLYAPLIWAGFDNILWFHLALYCALLAWLVWQAPPRQRGWFGMAALAAAAIPAFSLPSDTEVVCVALLIAAWQQRERPWVGALLLGLACAFKQYCWFFVAFFLLDALLARGWRFTLRQAAVAVVTFLLPNLPFLLASPLSWWTSLWLPISDPVFPMGMGFILVFTGQVLPFGPSALYAALEVGVLAGALWAYARWRLALRESALLLALVPLLFAFRSPPDFFAFAPWFALLAISQTARQSADDHEKTYSSATSSATTPSSASAVSA